jgi:eukaryotic-like serine/threonine-protein kinase
MLGPYRVLEKLGEGGMGEVYKAKDTRLDRSVAIKVLPPEFSADPDRRARFEREAKTIAGLTHPHICTLYDVGEHDGSTFLVMEHLQGETLADRLAKGPLPLAQALTVATEIADALSAAHRQGVIHRDLKPGNVMLTKTGAKLLDFGLAKLTGHGEQAAAAGLASAPTQQRPLTSEGAIVGTLQYMAPEQVEGKPADARTDLWALGAILYEMLTGKRAFAGDSAASLIGNIMNAEPPAVAGLQPLTPPSVDRLVRRCLAKAPDDRWDSAHDVADELRWMQETSGVATVTGVRPRRRRALQATLVLAGILVAATAGAALLWLLRPAAPVTSTVRSELPVSPADELNAGGVYPAGVHTPGGSQTAFTWTPDGRALVYVGRQGGVQQLYVRRLDTGEVRVLPNTKGAQVPAVSGDGQAVAFWAGGAIRQVPLGGGPVTVLVSSLVYPPWGLVWDAGGRVVFGGADGRIWHASPGASPEAVTTLGAAEISHGLPWLVPGAQTLVYTVRKREWTWGDEEIVAQSLTTGNRQVLLRDAADARYVPTGHLVFMRRGQLWAVPFAADRVELRGPPAAVLDGVAQALTAGNSSDVTGAAQFAMAPTGMLAWVPAPVVPYPDRALVTVDRRGQVSPLSAPTRSYGTALRVSPDGQRIAVTIRTLTGVGLWVFDVARGTLTPLTQDGEAEWPVWSPDGRCLLFQWTKDGRPSLATQPADGSAPPRVLVPGGGLPSSFTPDGRQLMSTRGGDLFLATLDDGRATVEPNTQTPQTEQWPAFSPDGRWLTYGSNVSGRSEVYVRPYPGPGPAQLVSIEGGRDPAWHPNGRELSFLGRDPAGKRWMMAVSVEPGLPPALGTPRRLFEFDQQELGFVCTPVRCYDVAPDGQRFYVTQTIPAPRSPPVTHINLVLNWFEELKAKVPVQR